MPRYPDTVPTAAQIKALIEQGLPGAEAEVRDTTGTGDHFAVTVRSGAFEGLSRIEQHKLVYEPLQEGLDDGSIHAVSIKTNTAQEEST